MICFLKEKIQAYLITFALHNSIKNGNATIVIKQIYPEQR
jgi:hypothetical protein